MAAKGSKYEGFIKEAILALKERTGSSLPAIKKYITAHHAADTKANWETALSQSLKRLTKVGKLVKVKLCLHWSHLRSNLACLQSACEAILGLRLLCNYFFKACGSLRVVSKFGPPDVLKITKSNNSSCTYLYASASFLQSSQIALLGVRAENGLLGVSTVNGCQLLAC